MKKQLLSVAITLVLVSGGSTAAFASAVPSVAPEAVTPLANASMEFTGAAVNLSLKDAVKKMQTEGTAAEGAKLTKAGYEVAGKSSSEAYSLLKEYGNEKGITGAQANLAKNYYKTYADLAYQASMNGLEATTVKLYYGILQAQENYRIAQETTKIKNTLYDQTKLKVSLGEAAKLELLQAENAKLQAASDEAAALTALKSAKMSFNQAMGYDLMQNVNFTDKLQMVAAPTMSLTDAINSAYKNRNEIFTAKYEWEDANLALASVGAYPKDSATYLKAKQTFNAKKLAYESTVTGIELEIRTAYMNLTNAKNQVTVAQSSYENAKEGARIYALQYQAGLCTMDQLQTAQNTEYLAQLGVYKAITDYDLAVYSFTYATGAGTLGTTD